MSDTQRVIIGESGVTGLSISAPLVEDTSNVNIRWVMKDGSFRLEFARRFYRLSGDMEQIEDIEWVEVPAIQL